MNHLPTLLKIEDAARELACSRERMRQLLDNGSIESVKHGRSRRVITASLLSYIENLPRS